MNILIQIATNHGLRAFIVDDYVIVQTPHNRFIGYVAVYNIGDLRQLCTQIMED